MQDQNVNVHLLANSIKERLTQLEQTIDLFGLSRTLELIASICSDKAQHISANWQDDALAEDWQIAGDALLRFSSRVAVTNVSPGTRK